MLRVAVALAAAFAVLGLANARPAFARECGIPDSKPVWVDFAGHDAPVPKKAGLVLAYSSGTVEPAAARTAGAATVLFDLNFNNRVGTPAAPADPATIVDRANRLFDFAVTVTGCSTPWIAENELFGAQTPTPWTATTAQYRANVLALVRQLAARGAKVFVTIANPPYTGGDAAQWWRDLAASAVLVRQVYFTAPNVPQLYALGPLRASRSMRMGMRGLVRRFTELGIPADRVALELQFQSFVGQGGRENLQPSWKWFDVVKLEALAVRAVTTELGMDSIWSWGWATFNAAGIDPDKPAAVCVYLWTRDPRLCDGPGAAGSQFDPSVAVGQVSLPAGVQCRFAQGTIRTDAVTALTVALRDRDLAASVLFERVLLQSLVRVDARTVLATEQGFVEEHFGGSLAEYRQTLRHARLSRVEVRAFLADELRRDTVATRFVVAKPSAAAVSAFYQTYASFTARLVEVPEPVGWLGERRRGYALETFAPYPVFTLGRARKVQTAAGPVLVKPLGASLPLGALPLTDARPTIAAALRSLERALAYDHWIAREESQALALATCVHDDLPTPAAVDPLTLLLPFAS